LQNGGKLVRVIGRDVIGRPSRISYVPSSDSVIVTDDQARRLRLFSATDWTDCGCISPPATSPTAPFGGGGGEVGRLLEFPSGHCATADGRLAVIDFGSKSVFVWNSTSSNRRRSGTNSDAVIECQTRLRCPGYVAITREGYLAVTDSKVRYPHCVAR